MFIHGDLHTEHVFVNGDKVSGIIDWSDARQGDAPSALATLNSRTRSISTMSSPATAPTSIAT